MVVAGLEPLSEIMRTDGEFLKQHQLNDELLEKEKQTDIYHLFLFILNMHMVMHN